MTNSKGFVLIIVLIFVLIIGALLGMLLQNISLFQKSLNFTLENNKHFISLEHTALQLMHSQLTEGCHYLGTPFQEGNFLTNKGCISNEHHYVFTDLGSYPCLKILKNAQIYASHHWLLSIKNLQQDFLQIRFTHGEEKGGCKNSGFIINEGKISWRYIPNYGAKYIY
jgi:type II secretory pathway pseudopilin PulG